MSKLLKKYWGMRSPMGFQGSGGLLQEYSMKKIVVIELFIVFVFLTLRYKLSPIGPLSI